MDSSTWSQAFLLWFWTNVGGLIGVFLSLSMSVAADHNNRSSGSDLFGIVGLIGLIAAGASLIVVPIAYVAFRRLLRISVYWRRLLTTATVVTGFFLFVVVAAATTIMGPKYSLAGITGLGGWAYWASALGAAALVYRQHLFRPDNPADGLTGEAEEPTA